jgi:hypothetical protein
VTGATQSEAPELSRTANKTYVEIAGVIILLISAVIAYSEYRRGVAHSRVESAFAMIDSWEADDYNRSLKILRDFIELQERNALREIDGNLSQDEIYLLQANYAANKITPNSSVSDDVERLYYFFNKIGLCAREYVCDGPILYEFYGSTAKDFLLYTERFRAIKRERNLEFAAIAEDFVRKYERYK